MPQDTIKQKSVDPWRGCQPGSFGHPGYELNKFRGNPRQLITRKKAI